METGIDIYMGVGGAPEGVLAAAALCLHRRPDAGTAGRRRTSSSATAPAPPASSTSSRKYHMRDMADRAMCRFAATGITDGSLLEGVRFTREAIFTHTVVMRASTGTVRWIKTEHPDIGKFD